MSSSFSGSTALPVRADEPDTSADQWLERFAAIGPFRRDVVEPTRLGRVDVSQFAVVAGIAKRVATVLRVEGGLRILCQIRRQDRLFSIGKRQHAGAGIRADGLSFRKCQIPLRARLEREGREGLFVERKIVEEQDPILRVAAVSDLNPLKRRAVGQKFELLRLRVFVRTNHHSFQRTIIIGTTILPPSFVFSNTSTLTRGVLLSGAQAQLLP